VLEFLRRRGASFFADIVRGTGKLKAEIETALWELVAAGMVTADGFDNLRSLINPKRRLGPGSAKAAEASAHAGALVAALWRGSCGSYDSRRGDLLDAVAALRCGLSRDAGA
jgi:hypothetical protein